MIDAPASLPASDIVSEATARRTRGFGGWLLRRVATSIVVLLAVSLLVFLATAVLPGDAARAQLGPRAPEAQVEALRESMGLNRPLVERYGAWLLDLLGGDAGSSIIAKRPVTAMLATPATNSLILGCVTMVLLVPLTLALGLWSGLRANGMADSIIGVLVTICYAVPMFIVATMLIYVFALRLRWLPAVSLLPAGESPLQAAEILILPVVTLLLGSSAYLVRIVRARTIAVLDADFVEAARLRGVSTSRLLLRHMLPSVLPPVIQVMVLYAASLVGGVVIVEAVFGYPGLGQELLRAVGSRDIPVVQAIAMLAATICVCGNLLADLLVIALSPRLQAEVWAS
ncbi:MAG: ABC transporter permease [Thermomicrobiales bacterium]